MLGNTSHRKATKNQCNTERLPSRRPGLLRKNERAAIELRERPRQGET